MNTATILLQHGRSGQFVGGARRTKEHQVQYVANNTTGARERAYKAVTHQRKGVATIIELHVKNKVLWEIRFSHTVNRYDVRQINPDPNDVSAVVEYRNA